MYIVHLPHMYICLTCTSAGHVHLLDMDMYSTSAGHVQYICRTCTVHLLDMYSTSGAHVHLPYIYWGMCAGHVHLGTGTCTSGEVVITPGMEQNEKKLSCVDYKWQALFRLEAAGLH